MLKLHFINVADGDAILVEERRDKSVFRMLVDTGRLDVGAAPGSLRCTAAEYLREQKISHIDVLVITHLHIDHFGGLAGLLQSVTFSHAYGGFFPAVPGARVGPDMPEEKTARKLVECLDQWSEDVRRLTETGCQLHTVDAAKTLLPTKRLRAEIICPDETACAFQREVWADMLAGRPVSPDMRYWSAKYRNPGSLRVRLGYAGRSVELAGDCYGAAWDHLAQPCDILKVPHHGDCKAVTETLCQRLRPRYAVISCEAAYIPRKDRPSQAAVELLRRYGARVWFTDSFSAPWHAPEYSRSICFTIKDDGTIEIPSGGQHDHISSV